VLRAESKLPRMLYRVTNKYMEHRVAILFSFQRRPLKT
jgi:hypothetical protein